MRMDLIVPVRATAAKGKASTATPKDIAAFRTHAKEYVAEAAATILNTPLDEDPAWTMYLPDSEHELESPEEMRETILAYIDATLRGSPEYASARKEALKALDDAVNQRAYKKELQTE